MKKHILSQSRSIFLLLCCVLLAPQMRAADLSGDELFLNIPNTDAPTMASLNTPYISVSLGEPGWNHYSVILLHEVYDPNDGTFQEPAYAKGLIWAERSTTEGYAKVGWADVTTSTSRNTIYGSIESRSRDYWYAEGPVPGYFKLLLVYYGGEHYMAAMIPTHYHEFRSISFTGYYQSSTMDRPVIVPYEDRQGNVVVGAEDIYNKVHAGNFYKSTDFRYFDYRRVDFNSDLSISGETIIGEASDPSDLTVNGSIHSNELTSDKAATGIDTITAHPGETAVGRYNKSVESDNGSVPVFSVGTGTSTSDRSNAITVYEDGTTVLKGKIILEEAQGDLSMGDYE